MPAKCKWIQTQTATLETNKLITSRGAMPCRLFLKLKPFADLFGLLALYVRISLFLEKRGGNISVEMSSFVLLFLIIQSS